MGLRSVFDETIGAVLRHPPQRKAHNKLKCLILCEGFFPLRGFPSLWLPSLTFQPLDPINLLATRLCNQASFNLLLHDLGSLYSKWLQYQQQNKREVDSKKATESINGLFSEL